MNNLLEFLQNDSYLLFSFILNIVLIFSVIFCIYKIFKINKDYIILVNKIGNEKDLDKYLRVYLRDVENIKKDNSEIKRYYTKLDNDVNSCIQKIGLIRYNAFENVGSDLSFAIALLDNNNNGIVFNGIYGSDSSNIYAKPIKSGESCYQLSQEEKYAIEIAEQNKNFIAKHNSNKLYREK